MRTLWVAICLTWVAGIALMASTVEVSKQGRIKIEKRVEELKVAQKREAKNIDSSKRNLEVLRDEQDKIEKLLLDLKMLKQKYGGYSSKIRVDYELNEKATATLASFINQAKLNSQQLSQVKKAEQELVQRRAWKLDADRKKGVVSQSLSKLEQERNSLSNKSKIGSDEMRRWQKKFDEYNRLLSGYQIEEEKLMRDKF